MTESLFLYSSANVYKMAENVYHVNTNVTIDGRGKKNYMLGLFSDREKLDFLFVFRHVIKRILHSLPKAGLITNFLNSFNLTLYEMKTHVTSYIYFTTYNESASDASEKIYL